MDMTLRQAIDDIHKHLPGQHDQQLHAGDRAQSDAAKLASRWYNSYKRFPFEELKALGEKYPYRGPAYRGLRLPDPSDPEAKLGEVTEEDKKKFDRMWILSHIVGEYETMKGEQGDTTDEYLDAWYTEHRGPIPTAAEQKESADLLRWYVDRTLSSSTGAGSSWSKSLGGMKYYQDLSGWDMIGEEMVQQSPMNLVITTFLDSAVDLGEAVKSGIGDEAHGDTAYHIYNAKEVVPLRPVEHYRVILSPAGRFEKHLPGMHNQLAHGGHDLSHMVESEFNALRIEHVTASLDAQNARTKAGIRLDAARKLFGGITGPESYAHAKKEIAEAEAELKMAEEAFIQARRELNDLPLYLSKHLPGEHDQTTHGREMFHGTTVAAARKILKEGLRVNRTQKERTPGKKGVYAADTLDAAIEYGKLRAVQAKKTDYGIVVLRGEPDEFSGEWGFGRFAKDVPPERIMRIEIRSSATDDVIKVLKSDADGDCFVSFIVDNGEIEYVDGQVTKHLPGRHDQKTHGGDSIGNMADPEGTGTPSGFYADVITRSDKASDWQALGLRMPTEDELFNAYILDMRDTNGNPIQTHITVEPYHGTRYDDATVDGIRIAGITYNYGKDLEADIRNMMDEGKAGTFERMIIPNEAGEPIAYHAEFTLPEDMQQKGLGMDFLDRSESLYESLGVKEIRLHANSSVGRYAWPKAGFDWPDKTRAKKVDMFYAWLQEEGVSIDDAPKSVNHTWDIATWVHPKGAHRTTKPDRPINGKEYLLHAAESYNVVKRLDPNDRGYRIGKEYFKMRKLLRNDLGFKSLVEKYGLPKADELLAGFNQNDGLSVSAPSTSMAQSLFDAITRQNQLMEQMLARGQQPIINNNLVIDSDRIAEAIRDAGTPVVNLTIPEQAPATINVIVPETPAPHIDVHPTITLPAVKTEIIEAQVIRGPDDKITGTTTTKTTTFEENN